MPSEPAVFFNSVFINKKSVNPSLTASRKNDNTVKKRLVRSALEPPPCRAGRRSCRTCDSGLAGRCVTKNVVYRITCEICADSGGPPQTYVGETKRCIRYRFDEHYRDAANCTPQTPFVDHMNMCHPNETDPRLTIVILRRCKDAADRKIAEALDIRDKRPSLNTQLDIGRCWTPDLVFRCDCLLSFIHSFICSYSSSLQCLLASDDNSHAKFGFIS